tara:strand:- start:218 stop:424 length:207 start_codon:yes stop_codon:yes gene_type:complete
MSEFIDKAKQIMGMDDNDIEALRLSVTVALLASALGLTEEQIDLALEQRMKVEISQAGDQLKELLKGE